MLVAAEPSELLHRMPHSQRLLTYVETTILVSFHDVIFFEMKKTKYLN